MMIEDNVMANPKGYELAHCGRFGTVYATESEFTEVFGAPHEEDPSGDKVTKWWHFETMLGRVTVRNWWSNPDNELSVCSVDCHAAQLAVEHFRRCKLKAGVG